LLNHLISEELPPSSAGASISNSDPITGQAAWYDVRVRIYKAQEDEPHHTSPQFSAMTPVPGMEKNPPKWQAYFAGKRKAGGAQE
jgi:hypothetical protein